MKRNKLQILFSECSIYNRSSMFRELFQFQIYFNNYLGLKIIIFGYGFCFSIKVFNYNDKFPFERLFKK